MLTGLPSIEVTLLAIWKLMIILAVATFLCLLAVRIWRPIRRMMRKFFRASHRHKEEQPSFENASAFTHTANLEKQKFSNI